jgi:hypothetical protein
MSYSENNSPSVSPRRSFAKLALAASIATVFAASSAASVADVAVAQGPPPPPGSVGGDWGGPPPPPPGTGGGWQGPPPPPPGTGGEGNPIGAPIGGVPVDGGQPAPAPAPAPAPTLDTADVPGSDADTAQPVVGLTRRPVMQKRGRSLRLRLSANEASQATIVVRRGAKRVAVKRVALRSGVNRLTLKLARDGGRKARYSVEIVAVDSAGNRAMLHASARR